MQGKKFDLVAFDVDGTLVDDTVFVWETLHSHFNTSPDERDKAFRSYMAGHWNYLQWFEHDLKLLKQAGATAGSIEQAINDMTLMVGVEEVLESLRTSGVKLIILSGSIDIVVKRFRLDRYFDEIYLNRLEFDADGNLAGGVATEFDVMDKATGLIQVARRHGIPLQRTAYVGDNFNDVAVAKVAGFSIAFNCKSEELARVSDVVIPGKDLRLVLPYLL